MPDLVLTDITDGCATVTMNRPEARNALSVELIEGLNETVQSLEREIASGAVRAMILAGAGKAFCAGMDLKAVMSDPQAMRAMLRGLSRVMGHIRRLAVPTIARVQGAAIGGGCGLMVVTDFAITHDDARIGYPEVSLGLCPAVVAPWLMQRIGAGPARAMLLAGQTISGREGYDLGLATHMAEPGHLEPAAARLARRLIEGSAPALATTKRWLNELDGSLDDDRNDRGADLSAEILAGEEAQARLAAGFGP